MHLMLASLGSIILYVVWLLLSTWAHDSVAYLVAFICYEIAHVGMTIIIYRPRRYQLQITRLQSLLVGIGSTLTQSVSAMGSNFRQGVSSRGRISVEPF